MLDVKNDQFKITFVTGDLHKIEPTDKFKGFTAGQAVEIPLIGEYWQLFESDVMPRWYVTSQDAKPKVIASTDTEDLRQFVTPFAGDLWKRTKDDKNVLMVPETRFDKNADVKQLPAQSLRGQIMPTPAFLSKRVSGTIRTFLSSLVPVSYTHLDVYKRQVVALCSAETFSRRRNMSEALSPILCVWLAM